MSGRSNAAPMRKMFKMRHALFRRLQVGQKAGELRKKQPKIKVAFVQKAARF